MGLISPGGENLLDFLELRQVLSTYDVDLRDPLWWPQERPIPMLVAREPLSPFQGNLYSLLCLDFQAEVRLTPRWHLGQPCGKASWESLEGKPQIP